MSMNSKFIIILTTIMFIDRIPKTDIDQYNLVSAFCMFVLLLVFVAHKCLNDNLKSKKFYRYSINFTLWTIWMTILVFIKM